MTEDETARSGDEDHEDDDMREFRHRHAERRFFTDSLNNDVARAEELYAQTRDNGFVRRTLVRTIFAQIEGLCAEVIDWARYYGADDSAHRENYSVAEREVLRGVVALLNEKGEAQIEDARYPSTKANVRFALSLVGRGGEDVPVINYGDGGWEALRVGFAVRDRLMHPKHPEDVNVSDDDLARVRRGREWFADVLKARNAALQRTRAAQFAKTFSEWTEEQRS